MVSKTQRRKNKKAAQGVKALYAEFERDLPVIAEPQEDPLKAPMQARANALGKCPTADLLLPSLETEAGKCLYVGVTDKAERGRLFQTFMDYDRALSLYSLRILGRQRFPAVSKMEFMPERLETRADDRPDLRTEDEKADSAKKAMRLWGDRLNQLQPAWARIIRSVSYQQETLVNFGQLTTAGRSFIAAIRALHRVADST